MQALAKVDNLVVPFAFPYVELRKTQPGFIARNDEYLSLRMAEASLVPQPVVQADREIKPHKATGVESRQEPFFE